MIGYYQFRFLTTKFSSCSWESGRSRPSMENIAIHLGQRTDFFVKNQMQGWGGRGVLQKYIFLLA